MKKIYLVALLTMTFLTACEDDDTDFSDIINAEAEDEYKDIVFDYSSLEETEDAYAEDDDDYEENTSFAYHIYIHYYDDAVITSGDVDVVDISVSGSHVTVDSEQSSVEYILSGECSDGEFKIYSESKMRVTLDGLTLTNPTGAVINDQCGKSLYIVLAEGSVNTLTDGDTYTTVGVEDMKGTIFSEGQIIFSGSGTLNVYANCKNAIASDDYIVFRPGNIINITSTVSNGVKVNDGVFIRGGVLNIGVSADGAKGINSENNVEISGGRTTIINSGGVLGSGTESTGSSCLKSDMEVIMSDGTLYCLASGEGGKGVNADVGITVTGGSMNVVTIGEKNDDKSPKGIKTDGAFSISGGEVYSYSEYSDPVEAVEGLTIAEEYTSLTEEEKLFEVIY